MSAITKTALKSCMVGAGVGLVVGVIQGCVQHRQVGAIDNEDDASRTLANIPCADAIQNFDSDLYHELMELGTFHKYFPAAFSRLCENINNLIEKHATVHSGTPINAGIPYSANRYVSNAVESIRELRIKVQHAAAGRLPDFDEHAAKIQEFLNNCNHNIIMETQDKLNR